MSHQQLWRQRIASIGAGAVILAMGAMVQAQQPAWFVRPVQEGRQGPAPPRVSDYWLGVECYPADPTLRAQLGIEKLGLVVEQVVPGSPGDKAGIQQHDVLTKAGGEALASVAQLVEAIEGAKDDKLSIELLRGGEAVTVEAMPGRRPQRPDVERRMPEGDMGEFRRWVESLRAGERPEGAFRYRIFGPGAVLPPADDLKLPKDLTISVTRSGDEPAKVKVTKGDKTWEATEDDLSELPDEVRPHVERMLGHNRGPVPPAAFFEPGPGGRMERRQEGHADGAARRFDDRMERQMKALNEQLERLQKRFEEMQKSLPKPQSEQPDRA